MSRLHLIIVFATLTLFTSANTNAKYFASINTANPDIAKKSSVAKVNGEQVITVTSAGDDDQNIIEGSLRWAILEANNSSHDSICIHFAISGNGTHVIQLVSELPELGSNITIDGTTQPGYYIKKKEVFSENTVDVAGDKILIKLHGSGQVNGGIILGGNNSKIISIELTGFKKTGIKSKGSGNLLKNNRISSIGIGDKSDCGIEIENGSNNIIQNNLIEEVEGSGIQINSSSNNEITLNRINEVSGSGAIFDNSSSTNQFEYNNVDDASQAVSMDNGASQNTVNNNVFREIQTSVYSCCNTNGGAVHSSGFAAPCNNCFSTHGQVFSFGPIVQAMHHTLFLDAPTATITRNASSCDYAVSGTAVGATFVNINQGFQSESGNAYGAIVESNIPVDVNGDWSSSNVQPFSNGLYVTSFDGGGMSSEPTFFELPPSTPGGGAGGEAKVANNWYFGAQGGLNFANVDLLNLPTPLLGGVIATAEGCVSMSDNDGNLLFYSDGFNLWNKNHTVLTGASPLHPTMSSGGFSSSQAAIVIPDPALASGYYIFTVGAISAPIGRSLEYNKLSVDGSGLVSFTTPANIPLGSEPLIVAEKITAVKHSDGDGHWILVEERSSANVVSKVNAYEVTAAGVGTTPVSTSVSYATSGTFGYLESSVSGTKVVAATFHPNIVVFDFNNKSIGSGDANARVLSNPRTLSFASVTDGATTYNFSSHGSYGVEFSPNERYVYVTATSGSNADNLVVIRFDLNNTSPQPELMKEYLGFSNSGGTLQQGSDGNIYVIANVSPVMRRKYLDVITSPNDPGATYLPGAVAVGNPAVLLGRAIIGLPNFPSAIFAPTDDCDPCDEVAKIYNPSIYKCSDCPLNAGP